MRRMVSYFKLGVVMRSGSYDIEMDEGVSGVEADFFNKYWEFSDFDRLEYAYKVDEICDELGLECKSGSASLVSSIGKLNYYPAKPCCANGVVIALCSRYTVGKIVRESKSGEYRCRQCLAKSIGKECFELIEVFKKFIGKRKLYSDEESLEGLGFTEKIVLCSLLCELPAHHNGPLSKSECEIGSYSFDLLAEKFSLELSSVASKGYLYQEVYGEDLLDLKKRCKFIWSYRKEYIPESLFEDFKAVRAFKFLTGVKLRVPETGMSLMTWKEEMLAYIKGGGLSMEDCERFLQIIEAIRYEEVVSKVRYVAKKLKIPVHYDFALDFELNKMGRSFDLSGCHKVIWIVAFSANKILARRAKEYAGGKDYTAAHIFRKLLARKLELMIEGGVTPEGEVIKSKAKADAIVAFLCKHVVGDAEAWGSSTTSDFVAKFMSSIELGFAR